MDTELDERINEVMDRLASASREMEREMSSQFSQPGGKHIRNLSRRIGVLSLGYAMLRAEKYNAAKLAA